MLDPLTLIISDIIKSIERALPKGMPVGEAKRKAEKILRNRKEVLDFLVEYNDFTGMLEICFLPNFGQTYFLLEIQGLIQYPYMSDDLAHSLGL